MNEHSFQVTTFEPNDNLVLPYLYFPSIFHFHSSNTLRLGFLKKITNLPDLITVSCSFPPERVIDFLWKIKDLSTDRIVPLIFVVDWSQPLLQLPGTTWGEKIGLLHSLSSAAEVLATLHRLMDTLPNDYN